MFFHHENNADTDFLKTVKENRDKFGQGVVNNFVFRSMSTVVE